ncbi:3-oxoacyl-[acyl-carrier-protein] synthase, KASII [Fulvivirga imtechensis AK7]|uniref:3-oxoacyl-[acyl-carrier-protein] synthase, KASII n=2 Tax=Fulvivirga TaxID=396811 RepID=L8JR23_9BACT|nr:3-oxoacyl-[acyl-carrier-protein] synthase, KASII [Fulvivirga imtechensis AK7]
MLKKSRTGISKITDDSLCPQTFYGAGYETHTVEQQVVFEGCEKYTFLERLFIYSIDAVLKAVGDIDKQRTVLVLSTTKGNIGLLNERKAKKYEGNRIELPVMARVVNDYFEMPHRPVVVSNACISGVSAILTAQKLIRLGLYDHAIVTGGDLLTEFVLTGFQSFMAISDAPCRPYDVARKGITLGEACATMFLTNNPGLVAKTEAFARVAGGGQANDANHISGPSRTGRGLRMAVSKALEGAKLQPGDIDYISGHGTATLYNDEMEAVAFNHLNMQDTPLNSLKGYFGHTLGAAGIVESIITIRQLNEGVLLGSHGYAEHGVTQPLNVLAENQESPNLRYGLKTISGFGGCNGAVIFEKA